MKKKLILSIIFTLLVGLLAYYIALPPINLSSIEFYFFILFLCVVFIAFLAAPSKGYFKERLPKNIFNIFKWLGITWGSIFLIIIFTNIILSPIFNSRSYSNRISVNDSGDFIKDIKEVDFTKIPLLDKDSSQKLGDRVMGQLSDLVSQFYVSDMYTQINYNDSIIRVTPLEYNGFIKYLTNRNSGVAGYITVNSVDGYANLVKLDKGMKYVPSAYFFENVYRKLRFNYPTLIFDELSFEIDNEGNPYFIAPVIKYSGVGLKKEIKEVVILDAVTGNSTRYKVSDVPSWVDHVYSASLIINQLNDWGTYKNGFLNSIFGQKNVVVTTDGYNYLTMDDDVFLYTGITSVLSDESNIGFVLTNMRTKETNFYSVAGAEEYSAMASAKGQVQQMNYNPTFPLLINLNNRPTYLISLKDNAGLVKMYAFVDVVDYQKVVVTDSSKGINEAARNYLSSLGTNYTSSKELDIKVKMVTTSIINGNTYYYIVDEENNKYRAPITINEYKLPFVTIGSHIKVSYVDGDVREITSMK